MTDDADRLRLRATFESAAERYDRMRPAYPPAMWDALAALASLRPGSRVLEVGAGTGQATADLAERGYRVVALEIGPQLAALAARRLADRPNAEVVVGDFETWPLPATPFDAVVFATSFHWVDPAVRIAKSLAALRPRGTLAVVRTHHVAGGTEAFFAAAQACYERWDPATPPGLRLETGDEIPVDTDELEAAGAFSSVMVRRYEWNAAYRRDEYLDLLRTYSGHIALEPRARDGLLECIGRLIDTQHGGSIVKRYLTELLVAQRAAEPGSSP